MISNRVLKDLLQEPLGPYHARDILHESTCQMKGVTKLVLYSFILEHNGHVTGLDESERPLEGQDNRKFRFRGVLKIADPNWLSDFGIKIVEAEINLRAKQHALGLGEGARSRIPQLTLEYLFQRHLTKSHDATHKDGEVKLMVLIQGEENMPAVYMRSSYAPTGLLWSSKAHNRKYKIATMDVESYSRSENFFWRWRLFVLMEKLCKLYPHDSPRQRTPRWFVERYLARLACPSEDRHRRLIFDEEDSDMNETGKTETPRHLLKPHMSEILGLFAAQAEWFITNNAVKREALFDIGSWDSFAKEVRRQRKEAARQGVKWGRPVGQEAEPLLSSEEDDQRDEDRIDRLVRENPVIGKSRETLARKIELARVRSNRRGKEASSISSDSAGEEDAAGGVEYVSDFSEPSDVEVDDSDHRAAEEEARDRIPWQLQVPPLLPDVDGRWWCPLRECGYLIDLHDLTEEEGRGVPAHLIAHILQKQWNNAAYDERILQGFRWMVTIHYLKHFEECGVKAERREGRASSFLGLSLSDGSRSHYRCGLHSSKADGGAKMTRNPSKDRCLYEGRWEVNQGLFQSCTHHKREIFNNERSRIVVTNTRMNRYAF
ncbi:hypothetical protein L210DRAFT_862013 [Boletus edulis BED1]|uniref:Uncharacterized protein n=1 Tax=Boletus edulis BED1 TaxID=1328754 RepID=A0AAD4GG32_BOLED|nr:hypothetical protein L210DRAFT_862013 [Boletus edulis BED1]